jgi:hypothetical protein
VEDNLDDLRVVVASSLDRLELRVRDVAAPPDYLRREAHGRAGLRVRGPPFAVRRNLCVLELREVLAEVGVGRQAVVADDPAADAQRPAGLSPVPPQRVFFALRPPGWVLAG